MLTTEQKTALRTYIQQMNASASSSRIGYINLTTREVIPFGQVPYGHGAGVQGNRMDILETVDGLKFLYLMRQTGTEFWRTLLWF